MSATKRSCSGVVTGVNLSHNTFFDLDVHSLSSRFCLVFVSQYCLSISVHGCVVGMQGLLLALKSEHDGFLCACLIVLVFVFAVCAQPVTLAWVFRSPTAPARCPVALWASVTRMCSCMFVYVCVCVSVYVRVVRFPIIPTFTSPWQHHSDWRMVHNLVLSASSVSFGLCSFMLLTWLVFPEKRKQTYVHTRIQILTHTCMKTHTHYTHSHKHTKKNAHTAQCYVSTHAFGCARLLCSSTFGF